MDAAETGRSFRQAFGKGIDRQAGSIRSENRSRRQMGAILP